MSYTWAQKSHNGYEVSSKGDKRFSAFFARMPDGRTIEQWYQCDVKGYDPGGTDWKLGKGKPSLHGFSKEEQYALYLSLWKMWALNNIELVHELHTKLKESGKNTLTDCFASTEINQARALSQLLNEWLQN